MTKYTIEGDTPQGIRRLNDQAALYEFAAGLNGHFADLLIDNSVLAEKVAQLREEIRHIARLPRPRRSEDWK